MTINYDNILDQLNKKFTLVSREGKNYFLNNENAVVACYDDNSISMFFEYPEYDRQLHTNKGLAVATFVKDFQVNEQIADVIILDGLNGAWNDTKIVGNYAYICCINDELRDFCGTNEKQRQFDQLPYEKRIEVLEKLTGASFKGAKIDGIRLFGNGKEDSKISSCGVIRISDGIASIELSDEMTINGIKVNKKYHGFDLNIVRINGKNPDFDYKVVYDFWRQENDWHYTVGRRNVSSDEVIEWTEGRKNGTVDEESIFYCNSNRVINIVKKIYEKIYAVVKAHKGDDDKLFRNAILKLDDGRKITVPFARKGKITLHNNRENDTLQEDFDVDFVISPNHFRYKFLVEISFDNLDKSFSFAERNAYSYVENIDEEQMETIMSYLEQLYKQISTLEYDEDKTHSIDNFTDEGRNIQQFNEEMKKLRETNPESSVLPSVETAVNWWIDQITGSMLADSFWDNLYFAFATADQDKIAAFKKSLSEILMDELSKGKEPNLSVGYGSNALLTKAMYESGINYSYSTTPQKIYMVVGSNSVKVSVGDEAQFEEIFADEVQKRKVK